MRFAANPGRADAFSGFLHGAVVGAAAAFGAGPFDVLAGVFDVAGFALHAVGGVDAQGGAAVFFDDFVNAGGALAGFRAGLIAVVETDGKRGVAQFQVYGLVFFVRQVGKKYAA